MILQEDVVTEGKAIYLSPFCYSEAGTVKRLLDSFTNANGIRIDPKGLPKRIQTRTGMYYDGL